MTSKNRRHLGTCKSSFEYIFLFSIGRLFVGRPIRLDWFVAIYRDKVQALHQYHQSCILVNHNCRSLFIYNADKRYAFIYFEECKRKSWIDPSSENALFDRSIHIIRKTEGSRFEQFIKQMTSYVLGIGWFNS